jgi:hypothetical protein
LLRFHKEFGDNPHLRTHVDYNDKENTVVYEGFTTDALSLVKNFPDLSLQGRKAILREVGLGLKDMHARNWIHLGMIAFTKFCLLSLTYLSRREAG